MKKRIFLILMYVILILVLTTGCGNKIIENSQNNSDASTDESTLNENKNIAEYETKKLEKFNIEGIDGNIIDICSRDTDQGDTLILTSTHKLYKYDDTKNEASYITDVSEKAEKLNEKINSCIVISNSDGTYSFYDTIYGSDKVKIFEDIKIEGELAYGFFTALGNDFCIFTIRDSKLYYTSYDASTKNKNIENMLTSIIMGYKEEVYKDGIIGFYNANSTTSYVLFSNKELYSVQTDKIDYNEKQGYHIVGSTLTPQLKNVEEIYCTKDLKIIYSTKEDENNIYVKKSLDNTPYTLKLPSEYKVKDISYIFLNNDEIIIEMNDKSVFYSEDIDDDELELKDEVTKLNKENHIVNFSIVDYDIPVILCDDGCIYEIK